VFKNSSYYKGFFVNGVYHGFGEYKTPEFGYKGNFANGYFDGEGLIAYNNGETYKGNFKANRRCG
jgi:hypothetical protein